MKPPKICWKSSATKGGQKWAKILNNNGGEMRDFPLSLLLGGGWDTLSGILMGYSWV